MSDQPPQGGVRDEPVRVLLVEDEKTDRLAFERYVRENQLPYLVETAASRAEGLDRLRAATFDVVLFGYQLGDGTGMDLLPRVGDAAVIFVTDSGAEAVEAMRQGADDHLIKDADRHYLVVLPSAVRNVLARRRADEALRASEARFRAVFEQAADSIILVDCEEGALVEFNDRAHEALGYTREEFGALKISDFEAQESPEETARHIAELAREGAGSFETRHRAKDGELRDVLVSTRILTLHGERFFLSVWHDITERKRAETERARLEARVQHMERLESLGVMAGGIAHDFNNLLQAILGNADLALVSLSDDAPSRRSIAEIGKAGRRAADLSARMLAYSGHGALEIRRLDLTELVRDAYEGLTAEMSPAIAWRLDLAADLPEMAGDPAQLRQVLLDLVTNGAEAIGEQPGTITISTGVRTCDRAFFRTTYIDEELVEGQYVWYEVADTGCGIDETIRDKIFDPFVSTKFTGRGLGLAAVFGIVRGHHGAIRVESEPGRGTTIQVLFPSWSEAGQVLAAKPSA